MNRLALVLSTTLLASRSVVAVNLVPYPDFDVESDLAGWSLAGNGLPTVTWESTENAAGSASGSGSALIGIHGAAGTAGWIASTCIPVIAGPYRVGAWMKTPGGQAGSGPSDQVGLIVNYYGSPVCAPNSVLGSSGMSYPRSTQWSLHQIDSVAPNTAMGAVVVVSVAKGPANGSLLTTLFDGIALQTDGIFSNSFD